MEVRWCSPHEGEGVRVAGDPARQTRLSWVALLATPPRLPFDPSPAPPQGLQAVELPQVVDEGGPETPLTQRQRRERVRGSHGARRASLKAKPST